MPRLERIQVDRQDVPTADEFNRLQTNIERALMTLARQAGISTTTGTGGGGPPVISVALAATQIAFGDASNLISSSPTFWRDPADGTIISGKTTNTWSGLATALFSRSIDDFAEIVSENTGTGTSAGATLTAYNGASDFMYVGALGPNTNVFGGALSTPGSGFVWHASGSGAPLVILNSGAGDMVFATTNLNVERLRVTNAGDVNFSSASDKWDATNLGFALNGATLAAGEALRVQNKKIRVTGTNAPMLIAVENTANGASDYAEIGFINNLGATLRGSLYFTSSNYTGTETHPSSFAIATGGGSGSAVTISPNNVLVMDIGAAGTTKLPAGDVQLTLGGTQSIEKQGTGSLFVGTLGAQTLGLYTNNVTRISIDGTTGGVTLSSLASGIVKATTGLLAIASASDVAGAITWPSANQILVSTGTSTAPTGIASFQFDVSGTRVLYMGAGSTQNWANIGNFGSTNTEYIESAWASNIWTLGSRKTGTGTIRAMTITSTAGVTIDEFLQVNGTTAPANVAFIAGHTTNSTRDRVQFYVGGGSASDSNTENTFFRVAMANTTVPAGQTTGVWSVARFLTATLTGASAPTISEATTLRVDGAPSLTTLTTTENEAYAVHVAGGQVRLDGDQAWNNAGGANYERVRAFYGSAFGATSWILKAEKGGAGTIRAIVIDGNTGAVNIACTGSGGSINQAQNIGSTPGFAQSLTQMVFKGDISKATATSMTYDGFSFQTGAGITFTGGTAVTTAGGVNFVAINGPSYATTATISFAASLAIYGPPTASGGGAITSAYPLWIQAGTTRTDGGIAPGGGAAATLANSGGSGPTTAAQFKWIPWNVDGQAGFIPFWK